MVKWSSNALPHSNGGTGSATWAIDDIAHFPHWLETVSVWHHEEWMRHGQWEHLTPKQANQNFLDRISAMQAHLVDSAVPSTFVAHDQVKPWGTASLVYYALEGDAAPGIWLTNMYVCPDRRSQGVGSALLEFVSHWTQENGISRLRLYTHDAARFYLKRGWRYLRAAELRGQPIDILALGL